jgi:hypothetical protein
MNSDFNEILSIFSANQVRYLMPIYYRLIVDI